MRPYDLDKAKELLEELGIVDRDGDGIRELPSGRPFELTLTPVSYTHLMSRQFYLSTG